MKFKDTYRNDFDKIVTLHVRVWIEILTSAWPGYGNGVTLHVRVWIEIHCLTPLLKQIIKSPST